MSDSNESKVAREAAEVEYQRILNCFDVEQKTDSDRETIIGAIMAGRLMLDEAKELLLYDLARPIEQKNGEILKSITFREPTNADLQYINKGQKVQIDMEGKTGSMDLSDQFLKVSRFLSQVCGQPLGIADRIKRRDAAVIKAICDFFG